MKIVLVGPPGVGKSTIADIISTKTGWPHISTGDILRSEIAKGTELGKKANAIIKSGRLLDDKTTNSIVDSRLSKKDCKKGFVIEGYPRTLEQAKHLLGTNKPDLVVQLDAEKQDIIRRISGRKVCGKCGALFHTVINPPKKQGVCDSCNSELYQRPDDAPESVKKRIGVYESQTKPVIDYYAKNNLLIKVDGRGKPEQVGNAVMEVIELK